ncbi:hypothetical protein [Ponticaulis koreensis]|uniref:hypothetical protein n=1 Tax=Ponticaulis koreensis TaxID=1123045 RepID=UPI0003B36397|nr:hypothetical protein [Ponticaulis koreensis]
MNRLPLRANTDANQLRPVQNTDTEIEACHLSSEHVVWSNTEFCGATDPKVFVNLPPEEIVELRAAEMTLLKIFDIPRGHREEVLFAEIFQGCSFFCRLRALKMFAAAKPFYISGLLNDVAHESFKRVRHLAVGIALDLRPFTYVDENLPGLADSQKPKKHGTPNSNSAPGLHQIHSDLSAGSPHFHPHFIQLTAEYNDQSVSTHFAMLPDIIRRLSEETIRVLKQSDRFLHKLSPSFGIDHPGVKKPVLWINPSGRLSIAYSSYGTKVANDSDRVAFGAKNELDDAISAVTREIVVKTNDSFVFPQDYMLHGRASAQNDDGTIKARSVIRTYYRRNLDALQRLRPKNNFEFSYLEAVTSPENQH